ncbi:ubiquitin-like protein 4A [Neocloeon triangulifer]|uniref:ubiquitin-like protein 4A n=1 Tax=Neocloeon triangulifer TaxID=2078957 RepID=UPI00286F6676|nr:ubiquitin-like protein 4A [Neocloeon triangulifer]
MKITIKMLQGRECSLEVTPDTSVIALKRMISPQLCVPVAEQKLLILGKPMQDDKKLSDYSVKEGCKINLIRRVCDSNSHTADKPGLRDTMLAFLLKHMPPDKALKVLDEFMKDFNKSINSLSIDDIERIAKTRLQEENHEEL